MLKRVFAVDLLVGAKCEGPMRLVAFVDDERIAGKVLTHLGLPVRAPPRGRLPGRRVQLEWLAGGADQDGIAPPWV